MTRGALLLVAVACVARGPRAPAPPHDVAALVALVEGQAVRACACADRACTDAVEDDLAAALAAAPPLSLVEDPDFSRADAAIQKAVRCLWSQRTVAYAFQPLVLGAVAARRDRYCACSDIACLSAIDAEDVHPLRHLLTVPIDSPTQEEADRIQAARLECVRVVVERESAPLVDEMEALRDRGCACADARCVAEVRGAFHAWSDQHAGDRVVPAQTERIQAAAHELATCLDQVAP